MRGIIIYLICLTIIIVLTLGAAIDAPDTLALFEGVDRLEVVGRGRTPAGMVGGIH